MNAIEKRARKFLDTELRKLGLHEDAYHVGCGADLDRNDQAAINAIMAALVLDRPVDLLDQGGAGGVQPKELDVVPSSAIGADEAGSVGIGQVAGGFPRDVELAEVTSEHGVGLRPEGDDQATADHTRVEGLKRASAVDERARSRAARANHQGEGVWE